MVQRYKFESKSQRFCNLGCCCFCCFQWFKGTNLKANHNTLLLVLLSAFAVSNGSKVQIWKQITTSRKVCIFAYRLFPMVQRYKFESKSQLVRVWGQQRNAVSNGSKVQIWKQITTFRQVRFPAARLFPMVQRYKFESKSQLLFDLPYS